MRKRLIATALMALSVSGCALGYSSQLRFPSPTDLFVTTGDGDIQKPYTPIGQLAYAKVAYRFALPLLGMIPISDIDPDVELRTGVLEKVKAMGGDGVINLSMNWTPPTNGFLGWGAKGGTLVVYGTVIKR